MILGDGHFSLSSKGGERAGMGRLAEHDGGRRRPGGVRWLGALSLACLCSCSYLQVHSYYAPTAPGGETKEAAVSRCGGNQGYVVSGPPQRIVVRSEDVALGIQASAYRVTTVAAGPLSFPVLPALPPSFFPQRALKVGDLLQIEFRILEPRDETVDFSGAVVEVVSDAAAAPIHSSAKGRGVDSGVVGRSTFKAGEIEEVLETFEDPKSGDRGHVGWTALWDLSDGWTLPLRVASDDPVPFRVSVRGLTLLGRTVEFPDVEFTPARGWLVCEDW